MIDAAPGGYNGAIRTIARAMTAQTHTPDIHANAEKRYEIRRADLPVSCPLPSMALWNSHPRVYLPLEQDRQCECPYCGAQFVLID